jgi:hypothetical protein
MQFSPTSRYFMPLQCKYSPQHPALKHFQCQRLSFTPIQRQKYGFVCLKTSVFWARTPCSPSKFNWRFSVTYCHHLQGRRISHARNQVDSKQDDKRFWNNC